MAIGSYQRFKGDCRIYRVEGREDWQIQVVVEGVIDVFYNGEYHTLNVGDCFIIPPMEVNDYIYRTNNSNCQSAGYYVHFSGTAAGELMDRLQVSGITVLRDVSSDAVRLFESLLYTRRKGDDIAALGNLLKIVSVLSKNNTYEPNVTEKLVRAEANFIDRNYTAEIDFDRMAARCNLSRSRFTHVFTKTFGVPPTQYQQNLKLEQAIELLRFSKLSVSEIAHRCGFRDPLYFSRVFRKTVGISPTQYKEKQ